MTTSPVPIPPGERRIGPRDRPCMDGQLGHPFSRVVVSVRCGNHSAFNGYHFTPSDYSGVYCGACGTPWRTKAKYVGMLKDSG